jgi:tetratricopeptide (TPR) repeat protein
MTCSACGTANEEGRKFCKECGGPLEVVATHYLDAYDAARDAPDAEEIRGKAREMLVRAGERAASLSANAEAQRAFDRAAELTDDPLVEAELHERAGVMAYTGARADEAAVRYERAIALFDAAGADRSAARVSARHAEILWDRGRLEQGLESMDRAFQVLSQGEPDADLAALAAQIGRFMFFHGDHELALERTETALDMAEALSLPEVLANGLNTKAIILISHERPREGLTLLRYALEVANENDKPSAALRAYYTSPTRSRDSTASRSPSPRYATGSRFRVASGTVTGNGVSRPRGTRSSLSVSGMRCSSSGSSCRRTTGRWRALRSQVSPGPSSRSSSTAVRSARRRS